MQQGGGSQSHQYLMGGGSSTSAAPGDQSQPQHQQYQMGVEEASPISSRPPATESLDEFGHRPENFPDMDDPDRGGDSGRGNRWPRQETLALLKIRAEMDVTFRDATVKGPLWEDVSRKMAELGFRRNAKKCKEKFENVDKYYKRTKEGRTGRQDGKTYKFFTELEALHTSAPTVLSSLPFAPSNNLIGIGFRSPTPISSVRRLPPSISSAQTMQTDVFPPTGAPPAASAPIEFSSNGSSSSPETEDDEDNDEGSDLEAPESSRKRKRGCGGGSKKMEFFEGLVKQVMQKQEAMQQKFLEAIEKREQDRLIREEAWRRQEIARLAREHEIIAQERAISASRDASILSFLQKVTGQTVHLSPLPVSTAAPTPFPPTTLLPLSVTPQPQPYLRPQQPPLAQSTALTVVPEQHVRAHEGVVGGEGPSPSRWPKVEVLALIRLRSELETRYHESGPKGPLWEEISAGMQRIGYKRNPKRCKEKWENINKYFKKVKESNKKRPEDAKTCPYFHELDALYRKRIVGGSSGGGGGTTGGGSIGTQLQSTVDAPNTSTVVWPHPANGDQEESNGGEKKPEDTVKLHKQLGFINPQGSNHHQNPTLNFSSHEVPGQRLNNGDLEDDYDGDAMDEEEDDEDDDEEEEEMEKERKMGYKIELQQRQNKAGPVANGGGNEASAPFLAMVQ